jgi:hypothetical protein
MKKSFVLLVLVGALMGAMLPSASAVEEDEFILRGAAQKAHDPVDRQNDVVEIDTTEQGAFGSISRRLNLQVTNLDNQIHVRYFFEEGTCNQGSPRIALSIDTDGDGAPNGNAFGYIGNFPNFNACDAGQWRFEDLTDDSFELEWDLTQFGGPFYNTWDEVKIFFRTSPNHQVLRGALVQDQPAHAYYDNLALGELTLRAHSDVSSGND